MVKAVDIKDMAFSYEKNPVLENVNLSLDENDFLAVIGPNGGGKTTLVKLILGFLKPLRGSVKIFGKLPEDAGPIAGYVPQFVQIDNNFPITVIDVVLGGLLRPLSLFPWNKRQSVEKARSALKSVGIEELAKKPFGNLSGGQKQRVLIARAVVSEPKILVLDEPTTSVDSFIEKDIYELLRRLNRSLTIILVTHDLGFISKYINRVACVNRHVNVHEPSDIDNNIIEETYNSPMNLLLHHCRL